MAWNVEVQSLCHVTSHEVCVVTVGVDRGNCTCDDNCNGVCICDNMRYTGKACNCSLNTTACMTGVSYYFVWSQLKLYHISLLYVLAMGCVNVTSVFVHHHVLETTVTAVEIRYDSTGI